MTILDFEGNPMSAPPVELSGPAKENHEKAMYLRGLAELVESCDGPTSIRVGARLKWLDDNTKVQYPVQSVDQLGLRLAIFTSEHMLGRLEGAEGAEVTDIRDLLNATIAAAKSGLTKP